MKPVIRTLSALMIAAAVLLSLTGCGRDGGADGAGIAAAVEILRRMESGDPDHVLQIVREQDRARLAAEREHLREQLLSGELDVRSLLQDYVILGDSRPYGFDYYGICPEERVLCGAGYTIRDIEPMLPQIKALDPARAYLSFGINDINIGYWDTPEEYCAEFRQVLDMLAAALPNMEIYVNSILPVQDWALYKGEKWPEAPVYNEAIRQMCEDWGCVYIDNDGIVAEHQSLYDSDGIHFQEEFYTYWAVNLIMAAAYEDGEEGEAP